MSNLIPHRKNTGISSPFGMFNDFFNDNWFPFSQTRSFKLDVAEEKDNYVVEAELPGIDKSDISVEINDGTLTIGYEQQDETVDENDKKYVHRERHYSSMQRSIYLGNVKPDNIIAKMENGILRITIPKYVEISKSNRIDVQ